MNQRETVEVVAAVIEREGRFLVCKRPSQKRHGGLWEFPGGKVLDGESYSQAIKRELREELDMVATEVGPLMFEAADPDSEFNILFLPTHAKGDPRPLEHEEIQWSDVRELRELSLAPSDYRFVQEYLSRSTDAAV